MPTSQSSIIQSIGENLVANVLCTLLGLSAGLLVTGVRRLLRDRHLDGIYGLTRRPLRGSPRRIAIVHSAIFDESRGGFNYPAADSRAARLVAKTLEDLRLVEGRERDFFICSDVEFLQEDRIATHRLADVDLILICSPKRNRITDDLFKKNPSLRYQLGVDPTRRTTTLVDTETGNALVASRDQVPPQNVTEKQDFGLITWAKNPYNPARNAIVLAGTHGAGTLGAAMAISSRDGNRIREISRIRRSLARRSHPVQVVIRAIYDLDCDDVVEVTLPYNG